MRLLDLKHFTTALCLASVAGAAPKSDWQPTWVGPAGWQHGSWTEQGEQTPDPARQWHLERLNAREAWAASAGEGVVIAILDSGVDARHPDLAGQLLPGRNFLQGGADTHDSTGHGTAVAGAAAAAYNELQDFAGLATRARILPLKVTDERGYTSARALHDAIVFAADQGVRVVNASFEGLGHHPMVLKAAQYLHAKGGLLVVPSGNRGQAESFMPSEGIITVAATDEQDRHPSWSAAGPHVTVAAPGKNLLLPKRNGMYERFSGTSFSSPLVAGVLALMVGSRPESTAIELVQALKESSVDLGPAGPDTEFGHGLVDAAAAVRAVTPKTMATLAN